MERWVDGWMDGLMNEWMDGWMDRWMDGWMDWWMDGWMDWWMDGGIDGWIDWWKETKHGLQTITSIHPSINQSIHPSIHPSIHRPKTLKNYWKRFKIAIFMSTNYHQGALGDLHKKIKKDNHLKVFQRSEISPQNKILFEDSVNFVK